MRDLREAIGYPFWLLNGAVAPDNHFYKIKRIRKIGRLCNCSTFIETGTFFGQTIAAVHNQFRVAMSVELSLELYEDNRKAFKDTPNIKIFHGDSSATLESMISQSSGRILFWLDGHFSGGITAYGPKITPIFEELEVIRLHRRTNDCILIDDARLFIGHGGFPKLQDLKEAIRGINEDYQISTDRDCLIALPQDSHREVSSSEAV